MGFEGEVRQVRGADEPVGDILIDDADFPWLSGRFTPGPGFAGVRELFARELALHIEGDRAWLRWSDEPFDEDGTGR
ncbi:hypothetical protein ACIP2Y_08835 [Streptomyces sviceus]|uniref:hypothetical protein n=1 Tax=Streptomyces sviceus TaxID=285530 RepID=UPI003813379A